MTDAGRLTRMDEFPRHQVGGTFDSVVSDSVHWNDGFYFTLGDQQSGTSVYSAIRLYPNTDVIDGFVCAVIGTQQHNLRWSRRLRPRIDDIAVGPLRLEIVEPLRRLHLTCADNPYGISFDLTWTGLHEPYLEDRVVRFSGGRKVYDRTNYDQCCDVVGSVSVSGTALAADATSWVGVRDHSWGLGRTGGPAATSVAPSVDRDPRRGFAMRQWTMIRMRDRVVFWQFHQQPDGSMDDLEAVVLPRDPAADPWRYIGGTARATRVDALPRATDTTVELVRPDGGIDRYLLTPVGSPAYLQGGGYHDGFADRLGRGVFRGDDHHEGEVWDVSHPVDVGDPAGWFRQRPDAWAEQFATCVNLDDPTDTGFGHLECVLAP